MPVEWRVRRSRGEACNQRGGGIVRDVAEHDAGPCPTNASTSPSPIPEAPPVTRTRLSRRLG